jgi:hypothetical protein
MLPKIAHVVIVGLTDAQRAEFDRKILETLRYVDPVWQYTSYGCATFQEAVAMAKDMERIDIFYIAKDSLPNRDVMANLEHDGDLLREMENHPSRPVVTYPNPNRPYKLAASIMELWRTRNKAAQ